MYFHFNIFKFFFYNFLQHTDTKMYVLVTAAKCRVCVFVRAGNVVQPHRSEKKKRSNGEFQYQIMYGMYIYTVTLLRNIHNRYICKLTCKVYKLPQIYSK